MQNIPEVKLGLINLEHSTNNKVVAGILCILLLIILFIGYYLLYIRKRLMNRWNLEQVLEINKQVLASSQTLKDIPRHIVDNCYDGINELLTIEMLSIGVYNEDSNKLEFAYNPHQTEWNTTSKESQEEHETLTEVMERCFETREYITGKLTTLSVYGNELSDISVQALPLMVEVGEAHRCVGVLAFLRQEGNEQENNRLLIELITNYVAIVVFNAVVKIATKYRDIESAEEDAYRASWEDSLLHVQNMVLDNCLSTIKHETIYYPSKIKNIIDKLAKKSLTSEQEKENIQTISELIDYYKGIFTILSSCAAKQLEEVTFRRGTVDVDELLLHAQKYFRRMSKRTQCNVTFRTEESGLKVIGDAIQLKFLLENLIDECLAVPEDGELLLETKADGEFVRFHFTDRRREKKVEELNSSDVAGRFRGDNGEHPAGEDGGFDALAEPADVDVFDGAEDEGRHGVLVERGGLVDGGNGEGVDGRGLQVRGAEVGERIGDEGSAVAVGVGLDHGADARAVGEGAAEELDVVEQCRA